ncbi:hypothetical protein FGO68_gene15578 [Halteria grandinella]|uniref:Uncharacterized protein n=1 Tax=Halteria grandinella TaxID=5974 RepID=A0A8J8NRX7_HALGN|nr:hypothetical protein FGO68_gene15578 [Halteria grandinella]
MRNISSGPLTQMIHKVLFPQLSICTFHSTIKCLKHRFPLIPCSVGLRKLVAYQAFSKYSLQSQNIRRDDSKKNWLHNINQWEFLEYLKIQEYPMKIMQKQKMKSDQKVILKKSIMNWSSKSDKEGGLQMKARMIHCQQLLQMILYQRCLSEMCLSVKAQWNYDKIIELSKRVEELEKDKQNRSVV